MPGGKGDAFHCFACVLQVFTGQAKVFCVDFPVTVFVHGVHHSALCFGHGLFGMNAQMSHCFSEGVRSFFRGSENIVFQFLFHIRFLLERYFGIWFEIFAGKEHNASSVNAAASRKSLLLSYKTRLRKTSFFAIFLLPYPGWCNCWKISAVVS